MKLTDEQLFKLIKDADPTAARIPPGIRAIADAIFAAAHPDHSGDGGEKSTGACFFCGEKMDGAHESDCPQAGPVPQDGETQTRYVVIGYGETDNPVGALIQTPEELLDAVLGMIYMHPSDAPADIREAYQKDLVDEDEWSDGIWRTEFEIGGIVIYDIGAPLASSKAAAVAVAVDESTYPSDPYIDTMAVNACVAGDGKGRLIFTIQAARKFALDVLRARDDGAFEAAAVAAGEPNVIAAGALYWSERRGVVTAQPSKTEPDWVHYEGAFALGYAKNEVFLSEFKRIYLESPAPIASSLSDRDIQEAALEWQCDPAFDHFVFHEDELVEYVRGILARVHPAAAQPGEPT